MPNWVKNKITFEGNQEVINKMFDWFRSEHSEIDFEKIIPCPDYIYQGNLSIDDEDYFGKDNCWYWWRVNNWGTKWNAADVIAVGNTIEFNTAWSAPVEIFNAILCKYKTYFYNKDENWSIYIEYADEDLGNNCGSYYASNNNIFYDATAHSYDVQFACNVWDYDYDEVMAEWEEEEEFYF